MSKASQVIDSLDRAWTELSELVNPTIVIMYDGKKFITVASLRDLEQIPSEMKVVKLPEGTAKAVKLYKGVNFECYLTAAEYEAVKERKTA